MAGRPPLAPGQHGTISASKRSGGGWRARARLGTRGGSVQVTATGPTRQGAIDALNARLRAAAADASSEPAATEGDTGVITAASTLAELAEEWWRRFTKKSAAEGTRRTYDSVRRNHLLPRFGDLVIGTLTVGEVDRRMMRFEEEAGRDSRTLRVVLRHVLDLAVRHDLLAANPVNAIEAPASRSRREPRALSVEEWQTLKRAIREWGDGSRTTPRDSQTLLDVMVTQAALGTRINEVLALRPCDLNLDADPPTASLAGALVYVRGSGLRRDVPKTASSARTLVLPAFAIPLLRQRTADAPTPTSPLFPSGRGTWLWANNLRRQWRDIRDAAGLGWVTPHSLRKTVATLTADHLTLDAAAAQLGHRSTRVTKEHYAAQPPQHRDAQAVADLIDEVLGEHDDL